MATHPTPEDHQGQRQPDLDQSRRGRFVYTDDDQVFITHDPLRPDADDGRGEDSAE